VTQPKPALPALLAELKSVAARGGDAFGAAYARLARTVFLEIENLEDANAERRYRQRARRTRSLELVARTSEPRPKTRTTSAN
jgi:hypothetical protein